MSVPHYTRLDPLLAVGCWPEADQRPWLAAEGITGLLSLQSDADLAARGVEWPEWGAEYEALGIRALRVPIVDLDPRDLARHLDLAVQAIHALICDGRAVYVHCNAGLNRSTTSTIAYLMAHRGLSLEAAWHQVTSRHRSAPYQHVLVQWARLHGFR